MTALRVYQAVEEEIWVLKVRNMEARAGDSDFGSRLSHAGSETKRAFRNRDCYLRTLREVQMELEKLGQQHAGNTSSGALTNETAEAALKLAAVAVKVHQLKNERDAVRGDLEQSAR